MIPGGLLLLIALRVSLDSCGWGLTGDPDPGATVAPSSINRDLFGGAEDVTEAVVELAGEEEEKGMCGGGLLLASLFGKVSKTVGAVANLTPRDESDRSSIAALLSTKNSFPVLKSQESPFASSFSFLGGFPFLERWW